MIHTEKHTIQLYIKPYPHTHNNQSLRSCWHSCTLV